MTIALSGSGPSSLINTGTQATSVRERRNVSELRPCDRGQLIHALEAVGDLVIERRQEVAVTIEGDHDRAVPHPLLDRLGVRAVRYRECHRGVSKFMKHKALETCRTNRRQPVTTPEVDATHRFSALGYEHEGVRARFARVGNLLTEHLRKKRRELDFAPASLRLRWSDF